MSLRPSNHPDAGYPGLHTTENSIFVLALLIIMNALGSVARIPEEKHSKGEMRTSAAMGWK